MSAMPAEKVASLCPACGRHSLTDHCASCSWMVCRNKDTCDLIFDTRNGRGHMLSRDGQPVHKKVRIPWEKEG